MVHAAMNITTGEVLTSNHSNHLKRRVAQIEGWNVAHGYSKGEWVFAHGSDWQTKLADKLNARRR